MSKLILGHPLRAERVRDAGFRVTAQVRLKLADPQATREAPAEGFCSKRIWPKATLTPRSPVPGATENDERAP